LVELFFEAFPSQRGGFGLRIAPPDEGNDIQEQRRAVSRGRAKESQNHDFGRFEIHPTVSKPIENGCQKSDAISGEPIPIVTLGGKHD
jgi:hypothetical protein